MEKMIYRTLPTIVNKDEVINMWSGVLDSGVLTMGKYTDQLEMEFAQHVQAQYGAVAVNSCASALYIALRSISPSDPSDNFAKKIIVPTNTFLASVNAIIVAGYEPVFADVDPNTMCMNMQTMTDAINLVGEENVFAVMPVHMAGYITPDMKEMCDYCAGKFIFVIEDCAHAVGSVRDNVYAGMFGDIGCFSLFATKTITSGEGGLIVSKHAHIIYNSRLLRNHGMIKIDNDADPCLDGGVSAEMPSLNFRMTEMQAALGLVQLRKLSEITSDREVIINAYKDSLNEILDLPPADHFYLYWHYIVKIKEGSSHKRDDVCIRLFKDYKIQTANIYKPGCHEQNLYQKYIIPGQSFNGYFNAMDRLFSIPIHTSMSSEDVHRVVKALQDIFKEN